MAEPGQHSDSKDPNFSYEEDDDIVESDVELDNTGVVEPDNDPPQMVREPRKYMISFMIDVFFCLVDL